MTRIVTARSLCWVLLLGAAAGCGVIKQNRIDEFGSTTADLTSLKVLAVVPTDNTQFGPTIANRVYGTLKEKGTRIFLWRPTVYDEGKPSAERLCGLQSENFNGVIFVAWNRITLRDCKSFEIVYNIDGGYAGVDEMTKRVLLFLNRPGSESK